MTTSLHHIPSGYCPPSISQPASLLHDSEAKKAHPTKINYQQASPPVPQINYHPVEKDTPRPTRPSLCNTPRSVSTTSLCLARANFITMTSQERQCDSRTLSSCALSKNPRNQRPTLQPNSAAGCESTAAGLWQSVGQYIQRHSPFASPSSSFINLSSLCDTVHDSSTCNASSDRHNHQKLVTSRSTTYLRKMLGGAGLGGSRQSPGSTHAHDDAPVIKQKLPFKLNTSTNNDCGSSNQSSPGQYDIETFDPSPVKSNISPVLPSTTTTNTTATASTASQRNPLIRPGWVSSASSTSAITTVHPTPMSCPGTPLSGRSVKETHHISIDYDPISGRKIVNTYEIIRKLGRGQHGKVKLAKSVETGDFVAIKIVDRTGKPRLGKVASSSQEDKVRREIAILKKCVHPNIVRLLEVLDDSTSKKIYLVLEYLEKGEVVWHDDSGNPVMTQQRIRSIARDILSGLEYLHFQGIIHRDIKPANLLLAADDTVKISDFGVSFISSYGTSDEFELAKTAGTPAFFAPELCCTSLESRKPVTHKIDIWAFGVTLFCLLYGRVPFIADSEYELFSVISSKPLELPELPGVNAKMSEEEKQDLVQAKDLLVKLLEKDPDQRIDIPEIKRHPWILKGMSQQQQSQFLSSWDESIEVTKEDVRHAVLGMRSRLKNSLSRIGNTALEFAGLRRKSSGLSVTTATNTTASSSRQSSQGPSRDATPSTSRVNSTYSSTIHHPQPMHMGKRYSMSPTTPSSLSKGVIFANDTDSNGIPTPTREESLSSTSPMSPNKMKSTKSNQNLTALLDPLESISNDEFVEVPASSVNSGDFPNHYSIIDYDENIDSDSDLERNFMTHQQPFDDDSDDSDDGELTLVLGPSTRSGSIASRDGRPTGVRRSPSMSVHRQPSLSSSYHPPATRSRSHSVTVGALNRK